MEHANHHFGETESRRPIVGAYAKPYPFAADCIHMNRWSLSSFLVFWGCLLLAILALVRPVTQQVRSSKYAEDLPTAEQRISPAVPRKTDGSSNGSGGGSEALGLKKGYQAASLRATNGPVRVVAGDVKLVYEVPRSRVKGVALLLHGCGHSAEDFWESSARCARCIGLPSEVKIARTALSRGYIALAVSSPNRDGKCWSRGVQSSGPDFDHVNAALKEVETLTGAPLNVMENVVAVGISSGGSFTARAAVSRLPYLWKRVRGIVVQIADIPVAATAGILDDRRQFPPVAFIYMRKDANLGKRVESRRAELASFGIKSISWSVAPKLFTVEFCRTTMPTYGSSCPEIVSSLRRGGFLTSAGGLREPGRRSGWQRAVKDVAEKVGDSLVNDRSPLSEMINVAWGFHEGTNERVEDAFEFVESR